MKRILCVFCVIGLLCILPQCISANEFNNTISEPEILDLLDKSSNALSQIHLKWDWDDSVPDEYNTYQKMHDYFATIYTDDIADLAWEQSRYLGNMPEYDASIAEYIQNNAVRLRGTQILIYSVDSNGIITGISEPTSYGTNYVWDYQYIKITKYKPVKNITGTMDEASADIVICDMGYDSPALFGYVKVNFKKTMNGWRITDSEYFHFVLNDQKCVFNEIDDLNPFIAETLIENKLLYKRYSIIENDLYYAYLISSNSKKAHYYIEIQDNKTDQSIGFYDAYFEKIDEQWTLVGGGVYELANGNDNAKPIENPYTGDSSIIPLILIMIVSLSAACFIAYRKKHLID